MPYIEEAKELATHYPYSYGVCEYVYLAHGNKAEEILKVGAQQGLSSFRIMQLSDVCYHEWTSYPPSDNEATDPIRRNLRFLEHDKVKLPKKLLKGWL